MRSIVLVVISPPKVVGNPGPASSIRTRRMLGASSGKRLGAGCGLYTDSCIVRPAMLPEGVGGNGRESCFSTLPSMFMGPSTPVFDVDCRCGRLRSRPRPHDTSLRIRLLRIGPWSNRSRPCDVGAVLHSEEHQYRET